MTTPSENDLAASEPATLPNVVPPAEIEPAPLARDAQRPRRWRRWLTNGVVWVLTLLAVAWAADAGLRIRRWTWEHAEAVHFKSDINRGYQWGRTANGPEGYVNLYDKMARQKEDWRNFLDYAPLRLAVMRQWAAYNRRTLPASQAQAWRDDYAFNRPILWFNAAVEGVGVIAAFFLVRRWVRLGLRPQPARSWPGEWWDRLRHRPVPPLPCEVASRGTTASTAFDPLLVNTVAPPQPLPAFCGWPRGLIAAAILWFNPAMILSAHAWPTWDAWVIPPFLVAMLCASYGRWFWAGVAIGVGTMFKGQQLVGLPVFFAWTLLNGDWRNALRFSAGLAVSIAAITLPWLTTIIPAGTLAKLYADQAAVQRSTQIAPFVVDRVWNVPAIVWTVGVTVVAAMLPLAWGVGSRRLRYGAVLLAAVLALCPAVIQMRSATNVAEMWLVWIAAFVVLAAAAALVRTRRDRLTLVVTTAAVALLVSIPVFGSSGAWWTVGIAYGSDHYQAMIAGLTDNLPGILQERYGWHDVRETMFTLHRPMWLASAWMPEVVAVTVKQFTRTLFVLAVLPCLWAVARHARAADPRLLVAAVGPWLAFFCLPTQIHERYLIYAAALSCVWIGQSVGMTLLGMLLTLSTVVQMTMVMLSPPGTAVGFGETLHDLAPTWFSPTSGITLRSYLAATFPDLAYANLLALAVVLYVALTRTPGRAQEVRI